MIDMKRRSVLAGAAALTTASLAGPVRAQPAKPARIVVNASGGAQAAGLRKAFFEEFERLRHPRGRF